MSVEVLYLFTHQDHIFLLTIWTYIILILYSICFDIFDFYI